MSRPSGVNPSMKLLDLTLDTPEGNLALDEALLECAEQASADESDVEVLRLWEPRNLLVVAGSASRLDDEVFLDTCARRGVPVLRRASGGTAIVTGPGCLMYAVVLSYRKRPQLRSIDHAHRFVLETMVAALNPIVPDVSRAGTSDLVLAGRKFSGNSLRCKRGHLLYHGTLLYQFALDEVGDLLKMPPRAPDYRQGRAHRDFLTNLPLEAAALRQALISAFAATEPAVDWPRTLTTRLVDEKYSRHEWNQRR